MRRTPRITLEPSNYPTFQANVLMGEGFTIHIHKEDGVRDAQDEWKLEWGSLRFATDGMANSDHFVNTVAEQKIYITSEDEKDVRIHVTPDPKKFMAEHNVFDIKANGDHSLGFKLCDKEGRCGESYYDVYFGLMVLTGGKAAERCWLGPDDQGNYKHAFDIEWLAHANVGHKSKVIGCLAILDSKGTMYFWPSHGYSIYSVRNWMPFSDYDGPDIDALTGYVGIEDYETLKFEVDSKLVSGPIRFAAGIWDKTANILKYDFTTTFDLCK